MNNEEITDGLLLIGIVLSFFLSFGQGILLMLDEKELYGEDYFLNNPEKITYTLPLIENAGQLGFWKHLSYTLPWLLFAPLIIRDERRARGL